jgi:hypothetical protein
VPVVGGGGCGALRWAVTRVTQSGGSATIVFSRGRAKPGFEMSVTAEWQLTAADGAPGEQPHAAGTLVIDELADSNGGEVFETWRVELTRGDAGKYAPLARAREDDVRGVLRRWAEALKTF